MGRLLTICLVFTLLTGLLPVHAAVTDEVEVKLTGGEVVGRVKGQGTASVVASVTNKGNRALSGIRVEAYYSTIDIYPPASAVWRPHEFIFDPPLAPGESANLAFTDDNAAEFVLLSVTAAVFHTGLSFNGEVTGQGYTIHIRQGIAYIATRDLLNIVGGEAGYDTQTATIILKRELREVMLWEGSSAAVTLGGRTEMVNPVLSLEGRSFVPLPDVAPLIGLQFSYDPTLNMVMLSDVAQ